MGFRMASGDGAKYLPQITTLTTGDLIFTGTPAGIGAAKGIFLCDGDDVVTTIAGVGTLRDRCVRTSDYSSLRKNMQVAS
jgi:2-keto-4-pentenoate hydratase/2-oxohepta-3-ene-1,7-dioic acid hydratase in catechol pathway